MKRAIIVFAKQPIAGTVKTRLGATIGSERAAEFYRCALADTLETIEQFGTAHRFLAFEPATVTAANFFAQLAPRYGLIQQSGETLGAKIFNAFQFVYAAGANQILVTGTDSPNLPDSHLENAFAALDDSETDAVIGRADDGGYYLIGMRRPHQILFERINWSSATVADETIARAAENNLKLTEIEPWYDIDTAKDLDRFFRDVSRTGDNRAPRTRAFVEELRKSMTL